MTTTTTTSEFTKEKTEETEVEMVFNTSDIEALQGVSVNFAKMAYDGKVNANTMQLYRKHVNNVFDIIMRNHAIEMPTATTENNKNITIIQEDLDDIDIPHNKATVGTVVDTSGSRIRKLDYIYELFLDVAGRKTKKEIGQVFTQNISPGLITLLALYKLNSWDVGNPYPDVILALEWNAPSNLRSKRGELSILREQHQQEDLDKPKEYAKLLESIHPYDARMLMHIVAGKKLSEIFPGLEETTVDAFCDHLQKSGM